MKILSLIDGLSEKTLQPVYLIGGPERFPVYRALEKIKQIILAHPMGKFNVHELNAKDASGDAIVQLASQIPMMGSKCLVIVEDAHKLSAESCKVLDAYIKAPSPDTCLVLAGDTFDARRGLTKTAKQAGRLVESPLLKESDIISFLKWSAAVKNVRIADRALRMISDAVGPDCSALDDAVERLGIFAGPNRLVEEQDVEDIITAVRQHSVFELVDAVGQRHPGRALSLLEGLLKHRQEPIAINAMLARHIRQLLKIRIHLHLGTDEREFASLAGAPPFMVKKLIAQARKFRGDVLEQALLRLSRADFEMKSAKRSGALIMEETVVDLCPPG
jgi:DNA polymerase III subunit delta